MTKYQPLGSAPPQNGVLQYSLPTFLSPKPCNTASGVFPRTANQDNDAPICLVMAITLAVSGAGPTPQHMQPERHPGVHSTALVRLMSQLKIALNDKIGRAHV